MKILFFLSFPFLLYTQNFDFKNYKKAVKYNEMEKFDKAIKYANKALKNNPNWDDPNLLLASIYLKLDNVEECAKYMLIAYDPDKKEDYNGVTRLIKIYYQNGYYDDALFYLNVILENFEDNFDQDLSEIKKNCEFSIKAKNNPLKFDIHNLGKNINTEFEEYLPAISVDGSVLIFSRRSSKDNISHERIFYSKKDSNNKWEKAMPLEFLNQTENTGAFSFSPDMSYAVYTACNRHDAVGGCDLYFISGNKSYNLGPVVNSKKWDTQACFSPDGKYLYFVSNRSGGFGGSDIWYSEIFKDSVSSPKNLGNVINTKKNEMSPFIHPDNLTFYFSSNGLVGLGDFDIYLSRRNSVNLEWGAPINLGYPINTHSIENSLVVENNGTTAYFTSNIDGYGMEDIFTFELPLPYQANSIDDLEINLITSNIGEEIILNNVIFESNSYIIDSTSYNELNVLVSYLKKYPDLKIEIQGHTDDIGTEEDNYDLSYLRAKAVYEFLYNKVENKLIFKGYGESKPIELNNSQAGREKNRRTSIVVIQ